MNVKLINFFYNLEFLTAFTSCSTFENLVKPEKFAVSYFFNFFVNNYNHYYT